MTDGLRDSLRQWWSQWGRGLDRPRPPSMGIKRPRVRALPCALFALALLSSTTPPVGYADEALTVSSVRFGDVHETARLSAHAETVGLLHSWVPAQLSAIAETIEVEVGDRVGQGEVIARLECSDAKDQVEQIEGRLEELQAERTLALTRLQRTQRLHEQNAVSEQQLDEATAEEDAIAAAIRSQRSRLRAAQRDVDHCQVRAPFEGVVTARTANQGEWLAAGQQVVRLLNREAVELAAEIPVSVLERASEIADPVFQTQDGHYAVELRDRIGEVDSNSRTREVRFVFADSPPLPGTPGRLRWHGTEPSVPAHLIVRRAGDLGVMVVRDGRAAFHKLPDAVAGRPAPAPELDDDARIIVDGRQAARADQPVQTENGVQGDE